jgi:hypothetical protein
MPPEDAFEDRHQLDRPDGEGEAYGELQRHTSWHAGRVHRTRLRVNADCRLAGEQLKTVLAGRG